MAILFKSFEKLLGEEQFRHIDHNALHRATQDLTRNLSIVENITARGILIACMAKKELYFASDEIIKFTGYSQKEIESMGNGFLRNLMNREESEQLLKISKQAYEEVFSRHNKGKSSYHIVQYSFHIKQKNGACIALRFNGYPIGFIDHQPCFIVLYVQKEKKIKRTGLEIFYPHENIRYVYNHTQGKFVESSKIKLRPIEFEVLSLTAGGYKEHQIAKKICTDINNVKYYKKKIMAKMAVNSMPEAVYLALKNKVL